MNVLSDYSMTIAGAAVRGVAEIPVINPATGRAFANAPDCSRDQLDAAIAAARNAFPGWAATPLEERRTRLRAFASAISQNRADLARLLTSEQGKPLASAESEITSAVTRLEGICTLDLPHMTVDAGDGMGRIVQGRHIPIGVVAGIAPWNYPVSLAMHKIAPVLFTGNTLVLKPSPFTPLTTLKLGELAREFLPPGVLNVISGGDDLGPWMTNHPGFNKISFTGSTQTGRRVMESAGRNLTHVTLELGGNDAAIVLPDADIPAVVKSLFWSAFVNSGQLCIATKRVYAHEDVYDELKDALVAFARTVEVGDGAKEGVALGPINNRPQYERVADLLADSKAQGHRFLCGGTPIEGEGYFLPVTLIDNPPEDSRIVREEQFGPVLPLMKYADLDDAIARANATSYGLGGSVWSRDEDQAAEVARRMETGNVWINDVQYTTALASFGGQKDSGIGVEGGVDGLMEYTTLQNVIRRKPPAGT
jgi:aldehyde dehydrogenase (NAD+)